MSKNSSSSPDPFPRYRLRADALPMTPRPRRDQTQMKRSSSVVIKYTEHSAPMTLREAEKYFNRCISKVFLVKEGAYTSKEQEQVSKGDIIVVCLKKPTSFLKLESPGKEPVLFPVVTPRTAYALAPKEESGNKRYDAIRSWEGDFDSVAEFLLAITQGMTMPAALRLIYRAQDHRGEEVPARTILFNIRHITEPKTGIQGIAGVDHNGTVHQFMEGSKLYFSTKYYDVKCMPLYFKDALQLPQTAILYQLPSLKEDPREDEEEMNFVQDLSPSIVTITDVNHVSYLMARKLSRSENQLGRNYFKVPVNADMKVVLIKLSDSSIQDKIDRPRQVIIRSESCPDLSSSDVCSGDLEPNQVTTCDVQAERKEVKDKEASDQAATAAPPQHNEYANVPADVSANGDIARSDKAADDRSGDGYEEDTDMSTPLIADSHQHKRKFKMEARHVYADAEEVLDHFRGRFIKDVTAEDIVHSLEHSGIISDGDVDKVTKGSDRKLQNEVLHRYLRAKCTKEALVTVCKKMISVKGNPKVNKLGKDMRDSMQA